MLDAANNNTGFCLEVRDGELTLKKRHAYYAQVQAQMLVCGKELCDFVVWTTVEFVTLCILFDPMFACKACKEKQITFI